MTVKEVVEKIVGNTPWEIESHWNYKNKIQYDWESENKKVESLTIRDGKLVIGI